VGEQRYAAVRAVIVDGEPVMDVAARFGVARTTVHVW
jgi:transposase-like protein